VACSVIVAKRILVGCAPSSLVTETRQHASSWSLAALAPSLRGFPVLIINSNDGYAADSDALGDAIASTGHRRSSNRQGVRLTPDAVHAAQQAAPGSCPSLGSFALDLGTSCRRARFVRWTSRTRRGRNAVNAASLLHAGASVAAVLKNHVGKPSYGPRRKQPKHGWRCERASRRLCLDACPLPIGQRRGTVYRCAECLAWA